MRLACASSATERPPRCPGCGCRCRSWRRSTAPALTAERSSRAFPAENVGRNRLIWGDNLRALASLAEELAGQVDLIYIDPPFDSRQDYKVRIAVGDGTDGTDQDLFLHLAPDVSHLARVLTDEAFGADSFGAEIIWKRTTAHVDTKDFGTIHDVIACFSKTQNHMWNAQSEPYDVEYGEQYYRYN